MFSSHSPQSESIVLEDTTHYQQIQAGAFSFICFMSALFAAAAVSRIPLYMETGDIARLMGAAMFGALVLICTIDNVRTHITLLGQRHMLTCN